MLKFEFNKFLESYMAPVDKDPYVNDISFVKEKLTKGDLSYWTDMNSYIDKDELNKIMNVSKFIRNNCDVFLVIGIGGSYMGAKAVIEAMLPIYDRKKPEILFIGTNLSSEEYSETLEYIKDKSVIVNVISKSGETLETKIAFNLVVDTMKEKYTEEELKQRIIITTDPLEGSMKKMAIEKGYDTFTIPKKIGGRFSVFSSVGLLPIAVSGVEIRNFLEGAYAGINLIDDAINYAVIRDYLFNEWDKTVESFTVYNGKLVYFTEWLKQLFGETQGKNSVGIFPTSCLNTRDLHSLGQFIQDGNDILFETVINVKEEAPLYLKEYSKNLNDINNIAVEKVAEAHYNGVSPSIIIDMDNKDEYHLGMLMQFFILSAISGALISGVDPFTQDGVEAYKKLLYNEVNK